MLTCPALYVTQDMSVVILQYSHKLASSEMVNSYEVLSGRVRRAISSRALSRAGRAVNAPEPSLSIRLPRLKICQETDGANPPTAVKRASSGFGQDLLAEVTRLEPRQ
jgi:hypothetical protein